MKYYKYKVQIDGTGFASFEDVKNYRDEVHANGGMCTEEQAAKAIIQEELESLFPDDQLLKLNEVLFAEDLKDPDIFLANPTDE